MAIDPHSFTTSIVYIGLEHVIFVIYSLSDVQHKYMYM